MKKLLAMLLALSLLLGLLPAALAEPAIAEPAPELAEEADPAALPRVGDVVNGFEVVELRDYAQLDAVVVRFAHQKTGAELYYIANDDTNRVFDLAFFTDAIDNTGLPHVFEHATLSGSEKYPNRGLFFNLSYQTYNTFMNAMTGSRYTTFPVASLSEAQLLKLADYYTDSCLHPMLMQDEDIYRTEAWRYRLESPEDELTLEGTVYSEMLGATTLQRAAYTNLLRAMYPGSTAGNDSGGDPDFIPDMTWQMLKDYHDRYYHPSNCAAYLYGQFEDYAAFLELLDGYFSAYERREFSRSDEGYQPIAEPVTQAVAFPVEQGSGTERAATVYYGIVCPGLNQDSEREMVLNTLTDLLYDSASNFQQSLKQALPYGSFFAYIEEDGPEDAIVFAAQNVNAEDAEVFKQTVDAALEDVAQNGFPQDQVDGVMASLNISALLIRENGEPVDNVVDPIVSSYASTGNPWSFQEYQESLFRMDEWNRQGLYAQAVSDWLLDSQTTALVTTYPEPGAKDAHDAALAEKLAQIKAEMSDEEIAALVEAANAETEESDNSGYLAQLKAVTVESLPEEWKLYDVSDETDELGVRHIDSVAGVDGIGMISLFLDAAGLGLEDIHWLQLYTDLIGELDTAEHAKAELAKLISRYLYDQDIYISLPDEGEDGYHPYVRLKWVSMDDDLEAGYGLMRELMYDTKVDDPAKLLEQVQARKSALKTEITSDPLNALLRRALGAQVGKYRYNTYATDLEYYEFLDATEARLQEAPEAVVEKLQGIQAFFDNSANAVAMFAGNAKSIALNRSCADAFFAALDHREVEPANPELPVPAASEALVIDSGVQYNVLAANNAALGLEGYNGGLDALVNLVSDEFLVPILRDQYGAYTPGNGASDSGVYIYTYRDPNIAETFDVLEQLPDMVAGMELDQDKLDGYIMSAYSYYAKPDGELTGALNAALSALEGKPQDEKLTWMRQMKQLTVDDVHGYADMYARLAENGVRQTAGGAAAINANAERFDVVRNPFGATDATQVQFADVTEEHEKYDAVRYAFENGLMGPVSEDAFGVDETATTGDMLAAAYVLIGGERDANEALAAFVEYGLASNDTDLTAPLTADDFWGMMSALAGAPVSALVEPADPAAVTRGELAEMLSSFMENLG